MVEHAPHASAAMSSASAYAALLRRESAGLSDLATCLTTRQRRLIREAAAWDVGGRAEEAVARLLVQMPEAGWRVLADRRWPGTRRANIDVIVVGAGGVFVIDVKHWHDVVVEDGRLRHGDADATDDVQAVAAQADAVADLLSGTGLAPTAVLPLLVVTGHRGLAAPVRRVTVLGDGDLLRFLLSRGPRLTGEQVAVLEAALDEGCPAMDVAAPARPPADRGRRLDPAQLALLDDEDLWSVIYARAQEGPVESWMTWLHPAQARLIARSWSGPARIRGAAGTGKTVVALHRAGHLAGRGKRVLVTSYTRNLARVQESLFARLRTSDSGSVRFSSVHALAYEILTDHGVHLDPVDPRTLLNRAWGGVGRDSPLADLDTGVDYWHDEVLHVIKGRAVPDLDTYLTLPRVGRATPLQPVHRRAVWRLYEHYEQLKADRGVVDFHDLLTAALDLVREEPAGHRVDAVVVDEVQDISCVGLRLLHALVGTAPDGLLLVGDGQQAIYRGGFTLAEAGLSVQGRSTVLTTNYRNREAILRYSLNVVVQDAFHDLDAEREVGLRAVQAERAGGDVVEARHATADDQRAGLLAHLRRLHEGGVRWGDMAVLTVTNASAEHWRGVLAGGGVPVLRLGGYDGVPVDRVKVGTFHRSKGLEFSHVCIPDRDRLPRPRREGESAEAHAERCEYERRLLHVAVSRARDGVWLGLRDA
ncbi:MAG: UvrD-helicase domain-containing protein [Kineosporiaceae bacterium]